MNTMAEAVAEAEDQRPSLGRRRYDWYAHRDLRNAFRHARLLRRMTGDICHIDRRGGLFVVVRYDPSGKEVAVR
jgi:hypothetical protein